MQIHKLGKRAVKHDVRTLQFSNYRLGAKTKPVVLPTPPAEVSWVTEADAELKGQWNMFMNDTLGDCGPAEMAHCTMQWSYYAGKLFVPTDADVQKVYKDVGGYVPGNPSTDNGVVLLDMLNYWRQIGIAGKKILAFLQLNPSNFTEIRESIELFGTDVVGLALPATAQGQDAWTVLDGGTTTANGAPGSWGGHTVPYMGWSPFTASLITWGTKLKASHNFHLDYCDEMYAVLSEDWLGVNGLSPSKLNLKQLQADFAALTGDRLKLPTAA